MASGKKVYYPYMGLVRYVLALGVVIAHFNEATQHLVPIYPAYYRVGGFFALSGFLVYPSFCKAGNLKTFYRNRAVRILPAYIFIILLSAIGLSAVSTLPLQEYFTSPVFWKYLAANLTFQNWLQPSLPGVFEGADFLTPAVNAALWTMKVDWCLYLTVPILFWVVKKWNINRNKLIISIIVLSVLYRILFLWMYDMTGRAFYEILSRQIFGQASYYYAGLLIYFNQEKFTKHLAVYIILSFILIFSSFAIPYGLYILTPVALSGAVLGVALIGKTERKPDQSHNISYQMYIFHYPLIKLLIYFHLAQLPAAAALSILLAAIILLSLFSQYCVEGPIIKRLRRR